MLSNLALANTKVELYDVLGRQVRASILIGETYEMSVSDLPSGICLLKVQSGARAETKQIMLE